MDQLTRSPGENLLCPLQELARKGVSANTDCDASPRSGTHEDLWRILFSAASMPGEFILGSFHKHRDTPSTENSVPIKKLSRLLLRWSLVFACVGAILILAGMAAAKYGSEFYFSAGHTAILVGMVALLYLGFLPALLGGVLWVFARRIAKSE